MEFAVEDTGDGVLLRPLKPFKPTELSEVSGCLSYGGPARTIEEMDRAIEAELQERHARGRY